MRISDWSSDVCSSDLGLSSASGSVSQKGQRQPPGRGGRGECFRCLDQRFSREGVSRSCLPAIESEIGRAKSRTRTPLHAIRSEERRVGKECVSKCKSRRSLYP